MTDFAPDVMWRPDPKLMVNIQRDFLRLVQARPKNSLNFLSPGAAHKLGLLDALDGYDFHHAQRFLQKLIASFHLVTWRRKPGNLFKQNPDHCGMGHVPAEMAVRGFDLFLGRLHLSVSVGCFDPSNEERAPAESQDSVGACLVINSESVDGDLNGEAAVASSSTSEAAAVTVSSREASATSAPGMAHPLDIPDFLKRRT